MVSLLSLLQAAARDVDLPYGSFPDDDVHWIIEAGLGPLLYRCCEGDPAAQRAPLWAEVRGASLAAQMTVAEHLDAMSEIIDACRGKVAPLVLLKGISLCEEVYPAPELRAMRDIDFLVPREDVLGVEATLLRLGYRQPAENPIELPASALSRIDPPVLA